MWGLGRVAALEHPDRWGGLVDLPLVLDDAAAGRLCAALAGGGEDQVAVRPAGVLGRRVTRARRAAGAARRWAPGGSVLVTGGTGAIGGQVARWAAGRGAARVVLASRSGPAGGGVAGLAAVLAAGGAGVEVVAGDVAERGQVAGLLARVAAGGPPLTAVFHTAGVGEATPIADVTLPGLAAVLAAKAGGAGALDELTAGAGLDAFVVFSSISATWGSGMQPGYAAANAYLDALAEQRRARGDAATSVAWGVWAGAGMGGGESGAQLQRRGLRAMDPDLAISALGHALDHDEGPSPLPTWTGRGSRPRSPCDGQAR